MSNAATERVWPPGTAPVAVVMISLNEGHNMKAVLDNLKGWAQEVFLVDSYSKDDTVGIALSYGVHVVQRKFRGFGDQWNFAMTELPIKAPWTMKLDPDERLSDELKRTIETAVRDSKIDGLSLCRHLWFMGRRMPVQQTLVRVWRTGRCRFTDVQVNEYPVVEGNVQHVAGALEHHDSPDLEHWVEKQNHYTTAEAKTAYLGQALADTPRLFGTSLQRRMWLKKNFKHVPLRFALIFLYHWLVQGAWRAGWVGYAWARLRAYYLLLIEFKAEEMRLKGQVPGKRVYGLGEPDSRVEQRD